MTNKSSPINVDVAIAAKASLEIKAKIPKSATGRAVNAITDIFSPFTEARGLKGDMIRLQREEVLFEIASRARRRLELEGRQVQPIPLKTLVPLMEKGSQEEPTDDFMVERWANLLASATHDEAVSPRFVSLLGEVNGRQARLLSKLYIDPNNVRTIDSILRTEAFVEALLPELHFHVIGFSELGANVEPKVREALASAGFHLTALFIEQKQYETIEPPAHLNPWDQNLVDLTVLESLGLVGALIGHWNALSAEFHGLTILGAELMRLTKSLRER